MRWGVFFSHLKNIQSFVLQSGVEKLLLVLRNLISSQQQVDITLQGQ